MMSYVGALKRLIAAIVLIASGWALYEAIRLDHIFNHLLPGAELTAGSLIARGLVALAGVLALGYLIGGFVRRAD
jgi:apolipoprotein N-acyltransferase